jgi:peptidoglycan/LPS O-acetylase OafA/YrhL
MTGPTRMVAVAYSILALAAGARSITQITTRLHDAPLAYGLSAVAAAVYLLIAVALRRPTRRSRQVVLAACAAEFAWVLVVGTATITRPDAFADETVWSHYGAGYAFVPVALPVLTLALLARNRLQLPSPRRISR